LVRQTNIQDHDIRPTLLDGLDALRRRAHRQQLDLGRPKGASKGVQDRRFIIDYQ
jgi:hypothetical protein